MQKYFVYIISFILHLSALQTLAQTFTDYKPQYKEWNKNYIIDKIDYTDTRTIIYFRYVARISAIDILNTEHYVTIFGKTHRERWCLENVANTAQVFHIVDVKNIRRNGKLIDASIAGQDELQYRKMKPGEVLTCEIHFKRLPNRIKYVNLLEGEYMKYDSNHFHAFNIKLKTEEEDLGSFEDMILRVHTFEKKMTGRPQSTFVIPNKKQNTQNIVKKVEVQKPKAPLLQPPQKPEYPQESQVRM